MTDREVVEHALRIAIDWESGLEGPETETRIAEYRRVLRRRYGGDRSYQEMIASERAAFGGVSIYDVINTNSMEPKA